MITMGLLKITNTVGKVILIGSHKISMISPTTTGSVILVKDPRLQKIETSTSLASLLSEQSTGGRHLKLIQVNLIESFGMTLRLLSLNDIRVVKPIFDDLGVVVGSKILCGREQYRVSETPTAIYVAAMASKQTDTSLMKVTERQTGAVMLLVSEDVDFIEASNPLDPLEGSKVFFKDNRAVLLITETLTDLDTSQPRV